MSEENESSLRIEIAKQPDGAAHMRCARDDGSVTWQKHTKHAAHFVSHDLTHFAVETTLDYRRGFFGLINEGWNIDDTTPVEAIEVERIVGAALCVEGQIYCTSIAAFAALGPKIPPEDSPRGI